MGLGAPGMTTSHTGGGPVEGGGRAAGCTKGALCKHPTLRLPPPVSGSIQIKTELICMVSKSLGSA